MQPLITEFHPERPNPERTSLLVQKHLDTNNRQTDRMFACLMVFQYFAGLGAALWISPKTWEGRYSWTSIHVWAAIFLGAVITALPVFLALTQPGRVATRHVIAVGQMLSCGLLIHLTGGRIETHFQYFGALAFLAFYRDWRVLFTATIVAGADHFIRGVFWPQSIFGVLVATSWRPLEHVGWIVFEDSILLLLIRQSLRETLAVAERQARLETINDVIESKVEQRTNQLTQEIVERKRAEESLELLKSAVEQSKDSILITDAELDEPGPRIVFVNAAFSKMTGYTSDEVLGKTPRFLQGPKTDKVVMARLRSNLERGEVFEGETINYRKDGQEFDLEWQIAPIRNAAGAVMHFVAIQRDVTDRNRIESRMFQSQKMETVGKLAGGVAHEFNSILTAIIGQSEFLEADLSSEDPRAKSAREIRHAADRAAALTRQLLAYGRKQMLQPEIIDLNLTLNHMLSTLQHLMGKEVDVKISPGFGLKTVKIDPGQIEQVIVNMALNAADAMPHGGTFTIETANAVLDEEFVAPIQGLRPGDYVMLAISDTGLGIAQKVKEHIFEPFFTTKPVGQGSGLGLTTCYGILKQSNGHINVYSEVGRGTTFKIYLPQWNLGVQAASKAGPSPALPKGRETILLVEDDPSLLEMASALLRRLGYLVLTANDGLEALILKQQRESGHVDLLLTDIVMPHMSGRELADRIRTSFPRTKILFTSAYTESAAIRQGILSQDIALLQKPFTPSGLARKVREVLDGKAPS
jgi:PAS domain S-box-containing protein